MILGITGHRKFKNGYGDENGAIYKELQRAFLSLAPTKIISGMAIGTDQIAVNAALELGIPFIAAVPFIGQEKIWSEEEQVNYRGLLSIAEEVVVVSPGGYAGWKMHARNKYIVEHSDEMLAVISPTIKTGGTYSCVQWARGHSKTIHYINPDTCPS